ncbi:hypothetical protein ACFQT0_30130 [Hymenobacter humi]|uniref:Uncharacterized protein n=1 Tax=Hymenobacter humi TaxID=1411620 RepID=A0ABW2UCG9_9BACT
MVTTDGGSINITNPFRGTLVICGEVAGKPCSIGELLIKQVKSKGFAGLNYDFKLRVLAEGTQKAFVLADAQSAAAGEGHRPEVPLRVINFNDLKCSEYVNPLRAAKAVEKTACLGGAIYKQSAMP